MKAIYAGSFDPFHNGHISILKQASELFQQICVMICVNSQKERAYSAQRVIEPIKETLKINELYNVYVVVNSFEMVADYAKANNFNYNIRGLRNNTDYNFEENIAKINEEINPSMKTIYFRTSDEIISSTFIKELFKYDKDISKYVSEPVCKFMKEVRNYG